MEEKIIPEGTDLNDQEPYGFFIFDGTRVEPKIENHTGAIIYERSYNLIVEMAIDALQNIHDSGKRVSNFQINEFKKEDGRCYYELFWA